MNDNNNKIMSGTIVYTICNMFVSGLAVVTSPIFSRIMSVGDYGIYSLFNSWNSFIFCISSLGLPYVIAPAKNKYGDKLDQFTYVLTHVAILIPFCLLVGSIFGLNNLFSGLFNIPSTLVTLLWIELIFYTIITFENNKLSINGLYKQYALICLIRALGSTVLAIVLIILEKENTYYGRVIGIIFFSALISTVIIIKNAKSIKGVSKKEAAAYLRFSFPIALPMIFHGLAMIILGQIDRVMISHYYTEIETGLYSYGYSIGTMIMFVLNASSLAVKPWFYEKYGKNNNEIINNTNNMVKMMLLVCSMFVLVVPEAIKLLADQKYWGTVSFVNPIICGCFCQYIYTYYSTIETIEFKTKYIAIGSALAAFLNWGLNALLLGKYSYEAAAYTTYIGYFVLMLFHMAICRFVCKQARMNYIKNILYSLVLLVISFIISLSFDMWYIRYIVLIVLILFIYRNYKSEIHTILRRRK